MDDDGANENIEDTTTKKAEEERTITACSWGDLVLEETDSGTKNADVGPNNRAMDANGEEL